ncbi:UNVERIFIED_CONTAM: hypothetical protein RMT77_008429 [Armadillidium vulgare]
MTLWCNTLVRQANVELKQEEQLILTNATVESTFAYEKKYFKRDYRFKVSDFVQTNSTYMKSKIKIYHFEWKHKIKNKVLKKNISETAKVCKGKKRPTENFNKGACPIKNEDMDKDQDLVNKEIKTALNLSFDSSEEKWSKK